MFARAFLFAARFSSAWRYYRVGKFSWRLSWLKSGSDYSVLGR